MTELEDALCRLYQQAAKTGYRPRRTWKLYKVLRGDLGCQSFTGRPLKRICTKDTVSVRNRNYKPSTIARYGRCVDCGKPLSCYTTCRHCGCDNYWAVWTGQTKKEKSK